MYEELYGLRNRPFATAPRVDLYYAGTAVESARQTLLRCIQRGEGPAVIIGPSGTGKTLLCQLLAEQLHSAFRVALLARGRMNTRRSLLQAILFELEQPYREMDEGELRLALSAYITNRDSCPEGVVVIVDEAHTLPLRLLDELRMLTNVAANGMPQARLVLAGGAALEERLTAPKLDSFSQRIAARCYLEALNREQTQGYIYAQLQAAGGHAEEIFTPEACQAVHRATDGVPRLINQVCDHTLLLACAAGRKPVDPACVEEAWGDLQQLPSPWNAESPSKEPSAAIIEFGGLDEEEEPATGSTTAAPDTVPMLRIRPQEDDVTPEPLEQLEQIEDALSQLDDDFQPAGSIGPEVELVFSDPASPFRVPGDPFSEPFEQEELVVDRLFGVSHSVATISAPVCSTPAPAPRVEAAPRVVENRPAAVNTPPAAVTSAAVGTESPAADDDNDIIVIEENYEETAIPTIRPVTPVRRNEYRRLFATLRHG